MTEQTAANTLQEQLIPVCGCWVKLKGSKNPGKVINSAYAMKTGRVEVRWYKSKETQHIDIGQLQSGFMLNMEVQDVPRSRYRPSLGVGIVVDTRVLGLREQVLVEFFESGRREWLPWQNLRQVKGVKQRLFQGADNG